MNALDLTRLYPSQDEKEKLSYKMKKEYESEQKLNLNSRCLTLLH